MVAGIRQAAFKQERGQPCPRGARSKSRETREQGCPRSSGEILKLALLTLVSLQRAAWIPGPIGLINDHERD